MNNYDNFKDDEYEDEEVACGSDDSGAATSEPHPGKVPVIYYFGRPVMPGQIKSVKCDKIWLDTVAHTVPDCDFCAALFAINDKPPPLT